MSEINQKQFQILARAQKRDRLGSNYFFSGPEGTGKFTLVLKLIELANGISLNISDETGRVNHPDFFLIEPEITKEGRKKNISIEQVKETLSATKFKNYQWPRKFLVVKEAEKMTASAANSLLKFLEEPSEKITIVLIAHKEHKILSTLRSRCQPIRLGLVSKSALRQTVESDERWPAGKADEEILQECLDLAHGRAERFWELFENQEKRQRILEHQTKFRAALKSGLNQGLELAEELSANRQELITALDEWIFYLRDFLAGRILQNDRRAVIQKVFSLLENLVFLKKELENSNVNQRLQVENFFVSSL